MTFFGKNASDSSIGKRFGVDFGRMLRNVYFREKMCQLIGGQGRPRGTIRSRPLVSFREAERLA